MEDTWFSRDLPVLTAIVELMDDPSARPKGSQVAEASGYTKDEVARALNALDGEYATVRKAMSGGDPGPWIVLEVTPAARRAVGQWPTPENVADRLLAALEQAADQTVDEEQRSRLRRAADSLKGLGRDVLPEVIANVITKGAMGL